MTAWMLALVLHAQPAPILEPDPGGWKRLQPRQMDASSFLANGWNQFEQNYLPIYASDDDPGTAWVEGAPGPGVGESLSWFGPRLTRARVFRIFVRSGYQKSKALFAANVRPRRVRLEPLVAGEVGTAPGGTPVEVELADALGWQKIELPVPAAVTGFKLTVLSVYPGTKYEDLCIGDVQVYVDGDDPYSAAAEQAAAERIRASVAERKAAAAAGTKAAVELSPRYTQTELGSFPAPAPVANVEGGQSAWSLGQALSSPGGKVEDVLKRARAAATDYESLQGRAANQNPVRFASVAKGLGSRSTSLASVTRGAPGFAAMLRYLALKDFAIFESTGADRKGDPVRSAIMKVRDLVEPKDPRCVAKCEPLLRSLGSARQAALDCFQMDPDGRTPQTCAEICQAAGVPCDALEGGSETHGSYAIGPLAAPSALFWRVEIISGDRDASTTNEDDLVTYQDGLATSLVSVHVERDGIQPGQEGAGVVYLFDWDRSAPVPKLLRMYRLAVHDQMVFVSRYDSA